MRSIAAMGLLAIASASAAQGALVEGFDDVSSLSSQGWVFQNNSDDGSEAWRQWVQGDPLLEISSHSGDPSSYLYADFLSTDATNGTISNWVLTPEMTLDNNTVVSFFTTAMLFPDYADRLQVRLSTSGSSTNVGTLPTDVGDFDELLLDINPTYELTGYPTTWTQYQIPLNSLSEPVSGRIALRYFVEDAGYEGANGMEIGVDDFTVVPEPTSGAILLGAAALGLARRRK